MKISLGAFSKRLGNTSKSPGGTSKSLGGKLLNTGRGGALSGVRKPAKVVEAPVDQAALSQANSYNAQQQAFEAKQSARQSFIEGVTQDDDETRRKFLKKV
jgi:hypothetical protein